MLICDIILLIYFELFIFFFYFLQVLEVLVFYLFIFVHSYLSSFCPFDRFIGCLNNKIINLNIIMLFSNHFVYINLYRIFHYVIFCFFIYFIFTSCILYHLVHLFIFVYLRSFCSFDELKVA